MGNFSSSTKALNSQGFCKGTITHKQVNITFNIQSNSQMKGVLEQFSFRNSNTATNCTEHTHCTKYSTNADSLPQVTGCTTSKQAQPTFGPSQHLETHFMLHPKFYGQ